MTMLSIKRFSHYITVIVTFISLFLNPIQSFAQAPEGINYQAVARDLNGNVLQNTQISIQFSVILNSSTGTVVYRELHDQTQTSPILETNEFGLFNLIIGQGVNNGGTLTSFDQIDWSTGRYFLGVEIAIGANSFESLGTTELVSVPFALYAKSSGNRIVGGNGIQVFNNDSIVNTGDTSNINELITNIEFLDDTLLKITEGTNVDSVSLASLLNSGSDSLRIDSVVNNINYLSIIGGNQIQFTVFDGDSSSTNEIQNLSIIPTVNGDSISISNGVGFLVSDLGLTNTDNQTLNKNGDTLFISGGNNVVLDQFADTSEFNTLQSRISLNALVGIDTIQPLPGDTSFLVTNLDGTTNTIFIGGINRDRSQFNERVDSLDLVGSTLRVFENGTLSDSIDLGVLNLSNSDTSIVSGNIVGDSIRLVKNFGNNLFIDISSLATRVDLQNDSIVLSNAINANTTQITSNALADSARICLLYTSPSPRDKRQSRMPSSA